MSMQEEQSTTSADAAQEESSPGEPSVATADPPMAAMSNQDEAGDQIEELFGGALAETETSQTAVATGEEGGALAWVEFFKPEGIPYAVIALLLMAFLARFVSRQSSRFGERFADRRLVIQQTGSLVRFVVYAAGLSFTVLALFELSEQMLLAIGGTLAVAGGFALKDVVASLLAGVIILMDRPFQVGDRVTFGGYYGEVTHIGLRSVRLMTLDDTQVTIPNNKFLTEAVASGNAGAVDMMIQVDLFIGADQNLQEALRLLSEVVTTSRYVNLNRRWSVLASEVIQETYFAIRLRAKAYVLDARLEKAFESDITERALAAFADAGVEAPVVLRREVGAASA